jgi:hypothetical protein
LRPSRDALAAGEDGDAHPDRLALALQRGEMLAREDFGRGEHRSLCPRFDRLEHRQQRHQSLARPDVALEQA